MLFGTLLCEDEGETYPSIAGSPESIAWSSGESPEPGICEVDGAAGPSIVGSPVWNPFGSEVCEMLGVVPCEVCVNGAVSVSVQSSSLVSIGVGAGVGITGSGEDVIRGKGRKSYGSSS